MEDALRDIGDTKDTGVETWMTGLRLHKGHMGDRGHWDTGDTGGGLLLICLLTLSSDPVIEIEMLTHLKNN